MTCPQVITVTDDEDPTITCPTDVTQNIDVGLCGAAVTIGAPTTGDNCSVSGYTNDFNATADASGFYPTGLTIVTWTVTDNSGNTMSCPQNVTITDVQPTLSINDPVVDEAAGNATFNLILSTAYCQDVVITYGTNGNTATDIDDYTGDIPGSSVTIIAGATNTTISIPVIDDNIFELSETFALNITSATNVSGYDAQGEATITDNDNYPEISISDNSALENIGAMDLTVSLSNASYQDITF